MISQNLSNRLSRNSTKYKLFQVADLICTTTLIEKRLASGQHLTKSEDKFFGGPRLFKRNILKYIKRKEI